MRIALVTNIPTPYRTVQFGIIKKRFPDFTVYFTGDARENRLWNVEAKTYYEFLPRLLAFGRFGTLNRKLQGVVRENDILILGGYEQPTYILLSILARIQNKPYILMYDGIAPSRIDICRKNRSPKKILKSLVINHAAALWANGRVSKKYFTTCFNYPANKIFNQYLSSDSDPFEMYIENKTLYKNEIRKRYDIPPGSKILLYSGRIIKRKRVDDIVQAIHHFSIEERESFVLLIIGAKGDSKIQDLCKDLAVNCVFAGFHEGVELLKHYFAADMLVVPSEDEPWGLVLNDAVNAEIPIVASDDCGASAEMIKEGKNGYIFETKNITDLYTKIKKTLALPPESVSETSQELKRIYNFGNSVRELEKAISCVGRIGELQ